MQSERVTHVLTTRDLCLSNILIRLATLLGDLQGKQFLYRPPAMKLSESNRQNSQNDKIVASSDVIHSKQIML
eukprot:m.105807 g.105807  ORF g.105807 m.105807 type:complete len:73 (+) comp37234_c0_seq7:141-359(+)